MIFDTHAHLNFSDFDEDREALIGQCLKEGIGLINVGTNYLSSLRAAEISLRFPNVYASVGMHPSNILSDVFMIKTEEEREENVLERGFSCKKYRKLALRPGVVAIGECGLDYYRRPKTAKRKEVFKREQREIFSSQIDLAVELGLPMIIHCREAFDEVLEMIKGRGASGVIHCFTGNLEQAGAFMDQGFYLGLNGIIFKSDLGEIIAGLPLSRVLVETDCPYLAPPDGPARNDPFTVRKVIAEIARIKGKDKEEVAEITAGNARKLFQI